MLYQRQRHCDTATPALCGRINTKSRSITRRLPSNPDRLLSLISDTGEERKLEFLVQPAPVTKAEAGGAVLLPCVATGYPEPSVYWMLGDKLIEER